MLGMIIGVSSVIILVSMMQGYLNNQIATFSDMGANNIEVTLIGRNGNLMLNEDDMYQYVKQHSDEILGVNPNVYMQGTISKNDLKEENTQIQGIDENYIKLVNKKVQNGHAFTYSNVAINQKVCIIGSYLNMALFAGGAMPGDTIRLNGESLTIVGILEEKGDSTQWSSDNCLYLPYTTAMHLSGNGNLNSFSFRVKNSELVAPETTKIQKYLFSVYNNTKSYKVTNLADMLKTIDTEMAIITMIIAGIGGISLVVAGIGIMNIMLVSVSERTREIGIRKSLGAKHKDIMRQFILEAAATSTLGGVLGILFGWFVTSKAGEILKFDASPNIKTILVSFGVSVATGILFGFLPARKAAKLNPIDALRSE
jgi:putative ABC transport system permease protein